MDAYIRIIKKLIKALFLTLVLLFLVALFFMLIHAFV